MNSFGRILQYLCDYLFCDEMRDLKKFRHKNFVMAPHWLRHNKMRIKKIERENEKTQRALPSKRNSIFVQIVAPFSTSLCGNLSIFNVRFYLLFLNFHKIFINLLMAKKHFLNQKLLFVKVRPKNPPPFGCSSRLLFVVVPGLEKGPAPWGFGPI